jgi:hypothetical protein
MVHHLDGAGSPVRFATGDALVQRRAEGENVDGEGEGLIRVDQLRWRERESAETYAVGGRVVWVDQQRRAKVGETEIEFVCELESAAVASSALTKRLPGFTSQWTTPLLCTQSSASAPCLAQRSHS